MQEAIEDPDAEGWTPEAMIQLGKEWFESMVNSTPPEELFKLPGPAKALEDAEQKKVAKILLRQLTRRFGDLSAQVREKITVAGVETLELWSDRVLDAKTLEEVLGPNPVVH